MIVLGMGSCDWVGDAEVYNIIDDFKGYVKSYIVVTSLQEEAHLDDSKICQRVRTIEGSDDRSMILNRSDQCKLQ